MVTTKSGKKKIGRPSKRELKNRNIGKGVCKLDDEAIKKLREIYALDASMKEVAYYIGVSIPTIYNWKKENKELFNELERIREEPVYLARETIVQGLRKDPNLAMKYLEKKRRKEFGNEVSPGEVELKITFDSSFDKEHATSPKTKTDSTK